MKASYTLYPPGKKLKQKPLFLLSFGVDPLNWQSFIEIGEIACSTTALCSRKHNLKNKNYHPISYQGVMFSLKLGISCDVFASNSFYFNSTLSTFTFESCTFLTFDLVNFSSRNLKTRKQSLWLKSKANPVPKRQKHV